MFFNLKLHGVWSLTTYFNPITLNTWAMTAGAVVMAGGSIMSSRAQNKQTATNRDLSIAQTNREAKASAEEYKANAKALLQNYNVTVNNLQQQAQEVRNQAGMELTQVKLDGLKNESTTSAVMADRGLVGATAARLNDSTSMTTALLSDQIIQKAESNMVDIMNKLTESKYNYENGMMSNAISLSRAATQTDRAYTQIDIAARSGTVSTVGMISGAIGAGAQGAALGKQLGGSSSSSSSSGGGK